MVSMGLLGAPGVLIAGSIGGWAGDQFFFTSPEGGPENGLPGDFRPLAGGVRQFSHECPDTQQSSFWSCGFYPVSGLRFPLRVLTRASHPSNSLDSASSAPSDGRAPSCLPSDSSGRRRLPLLALKRGGRRLYPRCLLWRSFAGCRELPRRTHRLPNYADNAVEIPLSESCINRKLERVLCVVRFGTI